LSATLGAPLPCIIQGGMGIGISNWKLARAVSLRGQLGVVSGTCIDTVFVRRLHDGDAGGHLRRALEAFPLPRVGTAALKRYFRPGGKPVGTPYRLLSMWKQSVNRAREQLTMLASFAEVYLAKEGHSGPVGLNLLTKVQLPNLATLYGAMLAGVDFVLMGAGIPKEIPAVLDALAAHEATTIRLDVDGMGPAEAPELRFEPAAHWDGVTPPGLHRPRFLPIVSSHSLATMLARKATGRIDGFVVERATAGGHNAPPRGKLELNERGEPVYGPRDEVDLDAMRRIGLPFWLAGGTGSPTRLREALDAGATGIQVGTLFAYTRESGLDPALRRRVLAMVSDSSVDVVTDPLASPTGFPFKVVQIGGTNSDETQYRARQRMCDLGYLRIAYKRADGRIGYRCPAEPVEAYLAKGGKLEDTVGRKCLCNALMADAGHAQPRADGPERALVTSGDDLQALGGFVWKGDGFTAAQVLDFLLGRQVAPPS
jgi:NAD(P)H-dependent flavin oxidoreductase YrpB (nitropropane dioxygenase family)